MRKHELHTVGESIRETVVLALNIGVKGPTRCLSAKTPVRVAEGDVCVCILLASLPLFT